MRIGNPTLINYSNRRFRLLVSLRMWLLRIGRWTLYFPSSFGIGTVHVAGLFKNWSACYVTLERKDGSML